MGKDSDDSLIRIQQRLAHLTRPLDYIRTLAENMDPAAAELIDTFGTFMAEQLQDLASSISKLCIELVQKDGNFPALSSSVRLSLDPQQGADCIKAAKTLAKVFSRSENSNSNRGYKRQYRNQSRKHDKSSRNNYNDDDDSVSQSFSSKDKGKRIREEQQPVPRPKPQQGEKVGGRLTRFAKAWRRLVVDSNT
ncbi:hypothetical protein BGX20_004716, partial [Mortierella sp. AD010]